MQNYWIGIMALAFVLAMAAWLLLVFNADRGRRGGAAESSPQREVIGGEFEAREGGRQLMPHPAQPSEWSAPSEPQPDAASAIAEPIAVPGQRTPATAQQDSPQVPEQAEAEAPDQGKAPVPDQGEPRVPRQAEAEAPEQARTRGDRP